LAAPRGDRGGLPHGVAWFVGIDPAEKALDFYRRVILDFGSKGS
jgi:hypothetical protein